MLTYNLRNYTPLLSPSPTDSEELLSSITSGSFKYVSVSVDLNQLTVATEDNNLILINLPDYFQVRDFA